MSELRLTQIALDSASPQGKRRDFSSLVMKQSRVRVKNAERVNKPLGARKTSPHYLEHKCQKSREMKVENIVYQMKR